MRWWHSVFLILLVGVIGILAYLGWNRWSTPKVEEPFQTAIVTSNFNLLDSDKYDSATPGQMAYTIFDMDLVETQRKILEMEIGEFLKAFKASEDAVIDDVLNKQPELKQYGLGTLQYFYFYPPSRQYYFDAMRILFSYIYDFDSNNPFGFKAREGKNIVITKDGFYWGLDINDKTHLTYDETGLYDWLTVGYKKALDDDYDLNFLAQNPVGYILSGKRESIKYFNAAPVMFSNFKKYMYDFFGRRKILQDANMAGGYLNNFAERFMICPGDATRWTTPKDTPDLGRTGVFTVASSGNIGRLVDYKAAGDGSCSGVTAGTGRANSYLITSCVPNTGTMNIMTSLARSYSWDCFVGIVSDINRQTSPESWVYINQDDIYNFNVKKDPDIWTDAKIIPQSILANPDAWGLPRQILRYDMLGATMYGPGALNPQKAYTDKLLTDFQTSKGDPSRYAWKQVPVVGTFTQRNRQEIVSSVSICAPLNFSDMSKIEKQLRITPPPDIKLYMSPNFGAQEEWKGELKQNGTAYEYIIRRDTSAQANNEINCNIELTGEMLSLIPYHARMAITYWADARADRLAKFGESGTTGAITSISTVISETIRKPLFDLGAPLDPEKPEVLNADEKRAILNAMAQLYYNLGDGTKRIKMFHDVYQVGETIFDARYEIQSKTSVNLQREIQDLTTEYESIRNTALTVDEINNLELIYQQKVSELFQQEEQNLDNMGYNCAIQTKYIKITSVNNKRICLSQIIASNNEGTNVARYGEVTNLSTAWIELFAGEDATGTQAGFGGKPLDAAKSAEYAAIINANKRRNKLSLLTDGIMRPRTIPNFYASNLSTPTISAGSSAPQDDFILVNIGGEEQITSVKLILPQILPPEAETSFRISILKTSKDVIDTKTVSLDTTTNPTNRTTTSAIFLKPNHDSNCATDVVNTYRVARFYASTIGNGRTASNRPDITKLMFLGFTESSDPFTAAALTYNPLYNCGFDIAIDDPGGGQLHMPSIRYTQNFKNRPAAETIDCSNPDTIRNIMAEYRLSQRAQGFDTRADVTNLPVAQQYNLFQANYYPSSVHSYSQLNPSTCAYTYKELKIDRATNELYATIDRYGTFVMTPDTENWFSQRLLYNIGESRIFSSLTEYNAKNPTKSLQPLSATVSVPVPLVPKTQLNTGNGACPEKYCSDTDVINQLVTNYNNSIVSTFNGSTWSQQRRATQILRVNRAVSGGGTDKADNNRCDYEAVFGTYTAATGSPDTAQTTFTSTISMYTKLNPGDCTYSLTMASDPGYGYFADANQPLLSKIYTYANEFMKPYYNDLMAAVNSLTGLGTLQTAETGTNITTALRTYRTDVLASYGSLKQLDGCDATSTMSRCSDPSILQAFIRNYKLNSTANDYITKILRAGTASGTECDFTYETQLGDTPTTRGARCKMVKDSNACAFSFDTTYRPPEVFHVSSLTGGFTYEQAYAGCQLLGGTLATTNELAHALRLGAEWCETPGWVLDQDATGAPLVKAPCGTSISTFKDVSRAGLTCVAPKMADPGLSTIGRALPFKAGTWYAPIQQMLKGCIEMMPMPPTTDDLADLGYQPTTASPLATAATTMTAAAAAGLQADAAISPRDFINCGSGYAIASADTALATAGLSFTSFYTGATQIVASTIGADGTTCLYSPNYSVKFAKNADTKLFTPVAATTGTVPATGGTVLSTRVSAKPNLSVFQVASDDICAGPARLATPFASQVVDSKRVNSNTCEYRVSESAQLPFGETFKTTSFIGTSLAEPIATTIVDSVETTSMFRFQPSLSVAATLQANAIGLITLFRNYWNEKYYTNTTATLSVFRDRVGKASQIGYSITGDSVYILAKRSTYGPLDPNLDIRYYNATECFRVVFRKPRASFFTTGLTGAFVFSATVVPQPPTLTVPFFPVDDSNGPDLQDVATVLKAAAQFRHLRFTLNTPAAAELFRLNLYSITGTPSGPFSCNPDANPNLKTIEPTRAYITPTDTTGTEMRTPSYLPFKEQPCDPLYDQVLDPVTRMSTCTLNISKITNSADRALYTYDKSSKPCQIGYDPVGQKCNLNYDFGAILKPYCSATPSLTSPRLELTPDKRIVIYLNDTYTINGYSITSGHPTKLPVSWTLEGSFNGTLWGEIHKAVNYVGPWVAGSSSIQNQFATTSIFRWNAAPIETSPMPLQLTSTIEGFQQVQQTQPQQKLEQRPSWLRIHILETQGPSKFVHIGGPLQFLTESGVLENSRIKVSNFGGSRRLTKEGPDALIDTQAFGQRWVDYNKAPLVFRFPEARERIRGFRFTIPTRDGTDPLPKRWRIESSWDGRSWTPIELAPIPNTTRELALSVVRFQQPF